MVTFTSGCAGPPAVTGQGEITYEGTGLYPRASGSTVDSLMTVTTIEELTDWTFGIFER